MTTATWISARWWTSSSAFASRKSHSNRSFSRTKFMIFCYGAPGCVATKPVQTFSNASWSKVKRSRAGISFLEDSVGEVEGKFRQKEIRHNNKYGRNHHRLRRGSANALCAAPRCQSLVTPNSGQTQPENHGLCNALP